MNKTIRELQEKIRAEESKMRSCHHEFQDAFYNPDVEMIPYGSELVEMGSDSYHRPTGYTEQEKPRWTRICTECGKEEHTHNKKPVVVGSEPDFGEA